MDLKQLEYFIAVCEQKSYSRAVDVLGLSQPSLSRHVQQLEAEVGQHLLRRTGRGVEPTPAGLRLLNHARNIASAVHAAQDDMQSLRAQTGGRIRLGLPPRISRRIAPAVIKAFRATCAHAALNISEGLSREIYEWISKGRLDIALLYDPPASDLLHYQSVFREPLVLAYSRHYRPTPPDTIPVSLLGNLPLVMPGPPASIRMLVDDACRMLNINLNVVAEVDLVQSVVETTLQADVCSILPLSEVEDVRHRGRFRYSRIEDPVILNNLVIACPAAQDRRNRLNDGVARILRERMQVAYGKGHG
ncbi:LysR family transcriptional regulator [Allopusillimonas soli]|uniref:LysR family transcriptional regulator n=1 Tax=Allopusillimonas soli TaxID=659016 RepID=A0A853FBI5_9BURK|nr:LysR family transcriptional regulator [Allopusillimonas soli]NYT38125.1 LysR family transcriptional regulator [Allopusillimonas soli]